MEPRTTMFPKAMFLPILIILICSTPSCFSTAKEDPPSINHHLHQNPHAVPDHDHGELPSIRTINDGVGRYRPRFESLIKYNTEILERLNRASTLATSPRFLNVDDFGAKGDGYDDSVAFMKAWRVACSLRGSVNLVVPEKRVYHLKPITFSGPCKSDLSFRIYGTMKASTRRSDYKKDRRQWIVFEKTENLKVEGGGTINGNGKIWWKNSCKIDKSRPCQDAPTAVTFNECNNLKVDRLRIKNAQQIHISFQKCFNVQASRLYVTAPGNSPNTDGIHVTGTRNILIMNSVVRTGDDCISIVSGSKNIQATDITCGPGHGISIGSLGEGNSGAEVSDVKVNRALLSGTTNGVRIKTWQGGRGYARNIVFQNVVMHNVSNPIIIDQNYCDRKSPCSKQRSAVQISNVAYKNIKGTSASKVAINLDCSKNFPCRGILLQNIELGGESERDDAEASCKNVRWAGSGWVSPSCS